MVSSMDCSLSEQKWVMSNDAVADAKLVIRNMSSLLRALLQMGVEGALAQKQE